MPRSPFAPLVGLILLSLASAAVVLTLALTQPWMGISFAQGAGDVPTVAGRVTGGPATGLQPGDRLVALTGPGDGARIALGPLDTVEEPDNLPDVAAMRSLFDHLGQVDRALRDAADGGALAVEVQRDGATLSLDITPEPNRPLGDLPGVFWVQLAVGLCGVWLGGWVLAIRGREPAAGYLAFAGVGLMASSHAAALYSTRELALPDTVFALASAINTGGALAFGIGMICLFLVYPVRYLPRWAPLIPIAVFGTWAVLSVLRLTVTTTMTIHLPVLVEMIGILFAAAGQVFATRGNPHARAALRWFGLSVAIGAGSFVGLIAMPQAMGLSPQISQGHAFALFLIIYAGLALGVARFRLFDLEFYAFRILFYAGGVAVLLLLDAALVYLVAMERIPAFSISLLLVAFLYLPARDLLARALGGRRTLSTEELFDLVSGVVLAPRGDRQRQRLHDLLERLFQPLEIADAPGPVSEPMLSGGGAVLDVPGIDTIAATRMHWANRGRRLFSPRDVQRVNAVLQMAAQFIERRRAYEAGAEEERRRINRDMHDNIGVQLLGALHSHDSGRKDALIRQTLTDLREIVSAPAGEAPRLTDLLGDLRAEISEHLAAADVRLDWTEAAMPDEPVAPHVANSVRAVLREGTSNILRHALATSARVDISVVPAARGQQRLVVSMTDDGVGPAAADTPRPGGGGNGLRNLRQRTEARGGSFSVGPGPDGRGTVIRSELSLDRAASDVRALRDAGE